MVARRVVLCNNKVELKHHAIAAAVLLAAACSRETPSPKQEAAASNYVNSSVCAGCHAGIAQSFKTTGMARSFAPVKPSEFLATSEPYYHKASDRYYEMVARGDRLIQRRYQKDINGAPYNLFEKEAQFVMGSGNHSRTYFYRTAEGRLMQLPLAWYAGGAGGRGFWAMNPGYDRPDHKDFRRAISYDCMACHNAYPAFANEPERGDPPLFPARLPEGIDCQRCHGPGKAHVGAAQTSRPADAIRGAILNPARLPRERQVEVCMQCHLETTSRTLPYALPRYGRGPFSYDPSEPLGDFVAHFDHPTGRGYDDKFEIAHAAYRLRKSKCFTASADLTCTTCHDPHQPARTAESTAQYRNVCMSCHEKAHRAAEDCTSCHMPKRRTDDVVHVVMTDHLIQRRKPARDLLAPIAERHDAATTAYRGPVVPYYPSQTDSLLEAAAQTAEGSNLEAGIVQLERLIQERAPATAGPFFDLAEAYVKAERPEKAVAAYRQALERKPDHGAAVRGLGMTLKEMGRLDEAAAALSRARSDPSSLNILGEIRLLQRRPQDAAAVLRAAVAIDPEHPEARANLAQAFVQMGDRTTAIAELREVIRIQPDHTVAHNNLANALHASADLAGAEREYKLAIASNPDYAEAHFNYGSALAEQRRFREAEQELLVAARLNPRIAEVHNNLGNLAAMQGRPAVAAGHFRRALDVNPALASAHLNLAVALSAMGDRTAIQHLRLAADGNDPGVREAAVRALAALGQTESR